MQAIYVGGRSGRTAGIEKCRSRLLSVALALMALSWGPVCSSAPLSFSAPGGFASGISGVAQVALQDINSDGRLDIVSIDNNGTTLAVLYGNGDGTFQAPINWNLSSNYHSQNSLAFGDFNKDGNSDIVATNSFALPQQELSLLLGAGKGTFAITINFSSSNQQSAYVANDCAANFPPNAISLSAGQGPPAYSITAADVNGDGNVDFIIGSGPITLTGTPSPCINGFNTEVIGVFLGRGDGTFLEPAYTDLQTALLGNVSAVAAADVNGDGKIDLVASVDGANTVYVLLGNGDGTFSTPKGSPYSVGSFPTALVLADLNKDGYPDIVTLNNGADTASILLNSGDGTGTFRAQAAVAVGTTPESLSIADMDFDGNLDLVVVPQSQAGAPAGTVPTLQANVLAGNGDGTFQAAQTVNIATGAGGEGLISVSAAIVGDVNCDGAPDIISGGPLSGTGGGSGISVVLNQGAVVGSPLPLCVTAAAGDGQVTLNWKAATGAASYNIYQGTSTGGESATPVQTGITGTSATIGGLTNKTTYYFLVAAVDANGTERKSGEVAAVPTATVISARGGGGGAAGADALLILGIFAAARRARSVIARV
jgi:hypothetical protein